MSRFEIKDIISQDKKGIVFRAHDSEKGHPVALRRFFPFGQNGGGLSEEEATAFRLAAQRLDGLKHSSLRSVIAGSVDPIDGMPYIVTEWIDGAPLDTILDGGKMEAPQVIEVLGMALVVSLALSEVLGEEAVWIETEVDSIFVGSQESHRGYVFWLSPFKWLGAETGSRNLVVIAELGERLAGWEGKLFSDQVGNGLGGYLKWLRNNPDASLAEALEALSSRTNGTVIPSPKPASANTLAGQPRLIVKSPSPLPIVMISAGVCLLLAIAGLAVYKKTAKTSSVPPLVDAVAATEPAPEVAAPVTAAPKPAPKAAQDDEDIAASRVNDLAAKLAREKEAKRMAAKAPPAAKAPTPDPTPPITFSPDAVQQLSGLNDGTLVRIKGILRTLNFASDGASIYFDFFEPINHDKIRCIALSSSYQGKLTKKPFAGLIGKTVIIEGKKKTAEWNNKPMVWINTEAQVTVVE